jgi:hypothetical protein
VIHVESLVGEETYNQCVSGNAVCQVVPLFVQAHFPDLGVSQLQVDPEQIPTSPSDVDPV